MKRLLVIVLTSLTCFAHGQDKYNYVHFNKLTEITGTEYVIATIENRGKIETNSQYLLFINTQNGKTKQIDFPKDAYIEKIEQIKIDSLGINKIFIAAKTVNLDNNKHTGAIVITGYYDTNNNGKYDKTDKNEILIYDLKTLKMVNKI